MLVALVGRFPGGRHEPRGFQCVEALDVDLAPDAALAPRSEADGVGVIAERFADAVDPAEAQCLIARLGPVDRRFSAALLPEADEQLIRLLMIGLEPVAEI